MSKLAQLEREQRLRQGAQEQMRKTKSENLEDQTKEDDLIDVHADNRVRISFHIMYRKGVK